MGGIRLARLARPGRPHYGTLRPFPRPRLVARASWEVEEVHETITGLLTPGWLVEPDPEQGGWRATPGLLDLRTRTAVAAGRSDAGTTLDTACVASKSETNAGEQESH
jgi:hypothetical protein